MAYNWPIALGDRRGACTRFDTDLPGVWAREDRADADRCLSVVLRVRGLPHGAQTQAGRLLRVLFLRDGTVPADPDFWQVVLRVVARRARSKPHRYALWGANHRPETRMITRRRASTGLDKNREKRRIPMARWAKSGPSSDHRNSHRPRNPATAGPSRAEKSPEHVRALE